MDMEQLLKPVEKPESVFIYRDDQKFTCTDYDKLGQFLTESLFETDQNERFMTDLRYSSSHPLMFEFSTENHTEKNTFDFWNRFVDFTFIRALQKYINLPEIIILQAMSKSQTKGLRIYVVGVEISHDDYLHLCFLLKKDCHYQEEGLNAVFEVRPDFPLPSCDRPEGTGDLYVPVRLMNIQFNFYKENDMWYPYRQEIIEFDQRDHESLVRDMMPIPQKDATHVHFAMDIFHESFLNNVYLNNNEYVAGFGSHFNNEKYVILRNNFLERGKGFCYNFLKKHANNIYLTRKDGILYFWYKLLYQHTPLTDPFVHLDQILKRQCPHLSNEPSPLKAVLLKYERPVYYALCNILRNEVNLDEIRKQFPFISKDLPSVPPKEAKDLNFNTILYCAYMTGEEGTIFDHLGVAFDYIAKNINSVPQLVKHVLLIQEKVFPVVFSNDTRARYFWDPNTNEWKRTKEDWDFTEFENVARDIVQIISTYGELPTELTDRLFNDEVKLRRLIHSIALGDYTSSKESTSGNKITETAKVYGHNVPEYYFLDEKFTHAPLETAQPSAESKDTIQPSAESSDAGNDKLTVAAKEDAGKDKLTVAAKEDASPDAGKDKLTVAAKEDASPDAGKDKLTVAAKEYASPDAGKDKLTVGAKEEKEDASPDAGKDKLTVAAKEDASPDAGKDKLTVPIITTKENAGKDKLTVAAKEEKEENVDKNKLNVSVTESPAETAHSSHFRVIGKETPYSSHFRVIEKDTPLRHFRHYHSHNIKPTSEPSKL